MFQEDTSFKSLSNENQRLPLFEETEFLGKDPFAHWHFKEPESTNSLAPFSSDDDIISSHHELTGEAKIVEALTLKSGINQDYIVSSDNFSKPLNKCQISLNNTQVAIEVQNNSSPKVLGADTQKSQDYSPGENATRSDVVCKSIIRGIKRHYCTILSKGKPLINSLKKAEGKAWLEAIEQFCTTNFEGSFGFSPEEKILSIHDLVASKAKFKASDLSESLRTYYEIKIMIACMVMSIPMKKKFWFLFVKSCYNLIYDIFSKYSKLRVEFLLRSEAFGMIFRHFIGQGYMERMMTEDPTFSANEDVYRSNLKTLWEIAEW